MSSLRAISEKTYGRCVVLLWSFLQPFILKR